MPLADESRLLAAIDTSLPTARRVLVLAPHPDDEVFGCGGLLAALRAQGAEITLIVVTDGAAGGRGDGAELTACRQAESRAAAALLGLAEPIFWALPDRGLVFDEPLIGRLQASIEQFQAELVLLPSPADWNPDHQTLALAGAEALRRLGGQRQAAFFEVTDPLPAPNLLLDIGTLAPLKQQAAACFVSQLAEQPYLERSQALQRLRATHLGAHCQAAEAFLLVAASELELGLMRLFEGPLRQRQRWGMAATGRDLPLVSVIVRSMDRPTLDAALDSVALQTYPNIEVVLVNAKGPEHRPLAAGWGRLPLRLVATGAAVPRTRAANLGLEAARGEYLMFLDDDDWFEAGHVAKLVHALQAQSRCRVACTGVRCINADDQITALSFARGDDVAMLLVGNQIPIHAALFERSLVDAGCRFDEHFELFEDWDFWLQLMSHSEFLAVDGNSALYRLHETGGSGIHAQDARVGQAMLAVFRKWQVRWSDEQCLRLIEAVQQNHRCRLALSQQDEKLAAAQQQAAAAESRLEQLQRQVHEQQNALSAQQGEQQRLQEALTRQQLALAEQQQLCQLLETQLAQRQVELEHVMDSRSMRLTRPLRQLRRRSHQLRHGSELVMRYVQRHGGWQRGGRHMLRRAQQVWQQGGTRGFLLRFRDYARLSSQLQPLAPQPLGGYLQRDHLTKLPELPQRPCVNYRYWQGYQLPGPVDIIVCVHNALEDVRRCLSAVVEHSAHVRLIIVDDGSAPATRDFLADWAAGQGAMLIRNEEAGGYTRAANQGLRASTGQHVILLNSDTIVTPGWVEKMVSCAESQPRIGLVGPLSNTASWQSVPQLFNEEGDWADNPLPAGMSVAQMGGLVARHAAHSYPRLSFLNGFCLLIKRQLINDIGIFDEAGFGRGYGEENDYCLRARAQGWQLALADNAYVFHAQSKSYSHEKRAQLAAHADRQLNAKHGSAAIIAGVRQCRESRQMQSLRAHARVMLEREDCRRQARSRWEGRRVLFVLPVMHACGGGNVVISEALAMMRMGVCVSLVNLSLHREVFDASHPGLEVPVIYIDTPAQLAELGRDQDAVIATAFHSVAWLTALARRATGAAGPVLGYYVQDFEPQFFGRGHPNYTPALQSYTLLPGLRLFTKTAWNRDVVMQHTGAQACVVGPSLDVDACRPHLLEAQPAQERLPLRLVAMVRPSTPRRNPLGTLRVLAQLQQRFGSRLELLIFGNEEARLPLPQGAENLQLHDHGHLRPGQVTTLLASADIFLDMSHYQAMGLTALEAMACGAVPVLPEAGGTRSFASHEENALLVDTQDEAAVVAAVACLIEDDELRRRLQAQALQDSARHYPERAASATLEYLFAGQAQPGGTPLATELGT